MTLFEYLSDHCEKVRILSPEEHHAYESQWRRMYGPAFRDQTRMRGGQKALFEFQQERADNWIVIPFLAPVPRVAMSQMCGGHDAFECTGTLVDCDAFRGVEFFIAPLDLEWSFVRTHEDFAFGGPYFVRSEWLPSALQS